MYATLMLLRQIRHGGAEGADKSTPNWACDVGLEHECFPMMTQLRHWVPILK
jgi:hypothetical protein